MVKRWMVFGSLTAIAACSILLSGCEPPNIIDAAPPGVDAREGFQPKEDTEPEALGEAAVKNGSTPKAATPTVNVPPALPTAKGETKTTPSGVVYETLQEGTGPTAEAGQVIKMHYTGTLEDGTKFDSSRDRGQPYTLTIGTSAVIKGWDEAVPGMKVGERRKLTIPPQAGYGALGFKPKIPPNATLIFDVELVEIVTKK